MTEAKSGSPSAPSEIVAATRNPHKLDEIRAILGTTDIRVIGLGELLDFLQTHPQHARNGRPVDHSMDIPEVVEDRPDLEGNAAKKAETLQRFFGLPTMADDTGLEVDALDGRPGVHSARYAGKSATDADNRRKLLSALADESDRSARFRTVVAFATDEGTQYFEGVCEGSIIREERGDGGFGYDPVFLPVGYEKTFAELPADDKNRISHRARAVEAFARHLGVDARVGNASDEAETESEARPSETRPEHSTDPDPSAEPENDARPSEVRR